MDVVEFDYIFSSFFSLPHEIWCFGVLNRMLINSGNVIWSTRSVLTSFKLNLSDLSVIDILLNRFYACEAWNFFLQSSCIMYPIFSISMFCQHTDFSMLYLWIFLLLQSAYVFLRRALEFHQQRMATNKTERKKGDRNEWLIVHYTKTWNLWLIYQT